MTAADPVRARLIELRRQAIEAMRRDGPEPGMLGLLAGIEGSLSALDQEAALNAAGAPEPPSDAAPADRAIVSDDGRSIWLTCYAGAERLAVAELDQVRAVALAGDLIEAAMRRLTRPAAKGADTART